MNGTILGVVDKQIVYQNNSTKPNRNIFVVGGPGSYKTQSVVITNLFNETENSIVVTDPKGELYEKTAGIKLAQGYQVHVVNFSNMIHSDRYNPFDYIERDIQAENVATKIVQSENKEGKKDVWFSTQRQLLKALILFVLKEREPAERNLAGVTKILQEFDVEAQEDEDNSPLDLVFLDLKFDHPARRAYELGFKKAKGEMKASIISSLLATVSKFTDEEVANFTSRSDFDLKDIGAKKIVLYVIIPVMDDTYESFINLFFSQLFDELYKLASDNGATLPNPVDFILDEFVNLGKFPKYEEFLATCRGYGIGVTTICQTLTQLQALYGKEKAESILGNHAVKICLNAANDVTAKYFSDLLGKSTVKVETGSESTSHSKETSTSKSDSYSYTSRSLMTADEIMRMPDTQSLLIFSNQRPVKATKAFQFKLFPNADSLVKLAQNDYQGQMELSQQAKFEALNDKWQEELADKKASHAKNDVSEEEEEDLQDELDQATSSKDSNETKDDVFY
ncbi:conjugal transfer protein [Leuconostoc citreum]|uniref:VirD4-like conjugal transfer protein, CD1115 family n=1 Tax=Leuconostoc TaxID=1243 RepID=UPI001CBCC6C7|nr:MULTISPECIES: type IV secretory system conjugative DNA transfer family protein [Leuconostoc]MBZ1527724.1 type IV secretory system conjugative DNA transfer family protein [Leuconostoc mesenteroides]MCT3073689.1 conjugal transfer protein [Leuconostoc citreum]